MPRNWNASQWRHPSHVIRRPAHASSRHAAAADAREQFKGVPYNLYFTPDGRRAIVVAEREQQLDFVDPRRFVLRRALTVPCVGVGLCVWPQPGRHSLGHTGLMR